MFRTKSLFVLLVLIAVLLVACPAAAPAPAPAAQPAAAEKPAEAAKPADTAATTNDSEARFQEILQCVQQNFPAEKYINNDLLPDPKAEWKPMTCEKTDKIKVLMPWVLNDEEAPWYNAQEKGFFKDVCLEVEFVPGGPGTQPIQLLAGGAVDIAVVAGASGIPSAVSSPTPADVVGVGTFLKHSPYIWMGLDTDTPKDKPSTKVLKPEDLVGKKIGIQAGDDYFAQFLINKYNLGENAFEIVEAGFTPDPLLVGAMDYFAAWVVNQPRLAEAQGFMNWTAFRFSDWGWDGYSDVSTVRRETLENQPDMVKRYLAATHQGLQFLLDNPEESADIAVKYGTDAPVTREQALRRFELQKDMIIGKDGQPIMYMQPKRWNESVASMIQYGQMELAACK